MTNIYVFAYMFVCVIYLFIYLLLLGLEEGRLGTFCKWAGWGAVCKGIDV